MGRFALSSGMDSVSQAGRKHMGVEVWCVLCMCVWVEGVLWGK